MNPLSVLNQSQQAARLLPRQRVTHTYTPAPPDPDNPKPPSTLGTIADMILKLSYAVVLAICVVVAIPPVLLGARQQLVQQIRDRLESDISAPA